MPKTPDLPPHLLAAPFSTASARAAGIEPARLRTRSLQHPWFAVRSYGLDLDQLESRCRAYAARMHPAAVFSHTTAARVWGAPLPLGVDEAVHVTVPVPRRAPSGRGVVGHQQRLTASECRLVNGLAVASPAATWAQVAELLSVEDVIAVGEHMLTGNPYEKRLPLCDRSDLEAAISERLRGPGHRVRVAALVEVREGPLSRPESLLRILLVRCGLPEPVINGDVLDPAGRFIAMPDLLWPEFRVALEYQGDHHREKRQFRKDISRLERLADEGWLIIQVSASELYANPQLIVERVARRLASRGWDGRIHLRRITRFAP